MQFQNFNFQAGDLTYLLMMKNLSETTLDSGINIGVRLLVFGLFSRGYVPYQRE